MNTSNIKLTFLSANLFLLLSFIIHLASQAKNFKDVYSSFFTLEFYIQTISKSCQFLLRNFSSLSPPLLPKPLHSLASELHELPPGLLLYIGFLSDLIAVSFSKPSSTQLPKVSLKKKVHSHHLPLKMSDIYICLENETQAPQYDMKGHFKYNHNTTFQQLSRIPQVSATLNLSPSLVNCHNRRLSLCGHCTCRLFGLKCSFISSKPGHPFSLQEPNQKPVFLP